jgi:hypothetical protein
MCGQVRRGVVERALSGLLNAAAAGEEAKGTLVDRIRECAHLAPPGACMHACVPHALSATPGVPSLPEADPLRLHA